MEANLKSILAAHREMIKIISIHQLGGVRYLAVTAAMARAVRRDRAMIDGVRPLGAADVYGSRIEWAPTGPREIAPTVKEALLRAMVRQ